MTDTSRAQKYAELEKNYWSGEYTLKCAEERALNKGISIGKAEGKAENSESIARTMLRENFSLEQIARITSLPLEVIEKLNEEMNSEQS